MVLHLTGLAFSVAPLSRKSETVAEFGDSLTFLRQCGQGLRLRRFKRDRDEIWQERSSRQYASIGGFGFFI